MSYSLVASDIPIAKNDDDIKEELMKRYDGIVNVSRWYFNSNKKDPMLCVQVDFSSRQNMKKVLDSGNIVIGGIYRRVSIVKEFQPEEHQKPTEYKTEEYDRAPSNEHNWTNLFAEQKKRLLQVMNDMEFKLNEVMAQHYRN